MFLIFILIAIEVKTLADQPKITVENKVETDFKEFDEIRLWYFTAKKYANNHKYISCEDTNESCFNCVSYSEGLYNISKELGFNVEMINGVNKYNTSKAHRWIRISFDVEPQSGEFVNYDNEYINIKEIK